MSEHTGEQSLSITDVAWRGFYKAVDSDYFRDQDASLIYAALYSDLQAAPFCKYLKRLVYRRAGMTGHHEDVPLKEYQRYILDAFRESGTPTSFTPTTTKPSAIVKNWLQQSSVKRSAVLLLGFGLRLNVLEVNDLLTKGLHEAALNTWDPRECICLYCYAHGHGYDRYERLWGLYNAAAQQYAAHPGMRAQWEPPARQDTDEDLLRFLLAQLNGGHTGPELAAMECFRLLYGQARTLVAWAWTEAAREENELAVDDLRDSLSRTDRLPDFEKVRRLEELRRRQKKFTAEDITPADLEQVLCSSVPRDQSGNLVPAAHSSLNGRFDGKRFSRKHIWAVLNGEENVSRFDLITLSFLVHAEQADQRPNPKDRYWHYIQETNRLMEKCSMGDLYVATPYECFTMMCMLADDPLGTYADVWEMSFDAEE